MIRKLFLPVLFVCFGVVHVLAQTTGDTVRQNYADRFAKLYACYIKQPNNVEYMIALSQFYADTATPMNDYAQAMRFAIAADTTYQQMMSSRRAHRELVKLLKRGISYKSIKTNKSNIEVATWMALTSDQYFSPNELDEMRSVFAYSKAMMRVINKKNNLNNYRDVVNQSSQQSHYEYILANKATFEAEVCERKLIKMLREELSLARTSDEVDSLVAPFESLNSVKAEALRRKNELAYEAVVAKDSSTLYISYLRNHPSSSHYVDVLDKLDTIAHKQILLMDDPYELTDFALAHQESELWSMAVERLYRMVVEDENTEAARLFISNFPDSYHYDEVFTTFYDWHANEGNSEPIMTFSTTYPDFPYPTIVSEDIKKGLTIDSIDINRPFKEAELPQWASTIYHLTGRDVSFVALQRTLQPLIDKKDWKAALKRMDKFEICFESFATKQFTTLKQLIEKRTDDYTPTIEFRPTYSVSHPQLLNSGHRIIYNQHSNGQSKIRLAASVASKKYKWKATHTVSFDNLNGENNIFYSLYDNESRMLFGRDGDLWTATRVNDTLWHADAPLPEPVNSDYIETDAFMMADGSGIIFASDRPGGRNCQSSGSYYHGDTALALDLYYVPRSGNSWGKAINLGKNINTAYCERSPWMSPDLSKLFFISDGNPGLGYGDIYCSSRSNIGVWNKWNEPVNLGKSLNTGHDEASLSISPNGGKILFTSEHLGYYGCYASTMQPCEYAIRRVSVKTTGSVTVSILDCTTTATLYLDTVSAGTATPAHELYEAKAYLVKVVSENESHFIPAAILPKGHTNNINLRHYDFSASVQDAPLGERIPLPAITISDREHLLEPIAEFEIENISSFLKHNTGLSVVLHVVSTTAITDNTDSETAYNQSIQLARELKKQLIARGVADKRIVTVAYGSSHSAPALNGASVAIEFRTFNNTY